MQLHNIWENTITITMESLLIGTGWHEVEKQDSIYFRWSGPDRFSTIYLNPRRDHDNRLNLTIHAAAQRENLNRIVLGS